MRKIMFHCCWTVFVAVAGPAFAEENQLICHQHFAGAIPFDSSEARKYAPSREIDILHLALDITPDFKERSIVGKATLRFKPIAKALTELQLDAEDISIASVTSSAKPLGFHATDEKIVITFEPPIPAGQESAVTISYSASPKQGLYFRTPEMGYKPEDTHLWTQGEPTEARSWFPSYDHPNTKFTSEVTCRVPEGMVVLSNGKLVSEEREGDSGRVAVRWLQDKPHANYLIALCAGYFKKVEDKYKDIPLAFFTPASQIAEAQNSFAPDTKDAMAFFEQEIGVPYPWAKYYQVCVEDFGWGGMENTTLTVLNDNTLHTSATENLRDSQGLIAHELAHQWFGDFVTCKDWANVWLNEGFATYYEKLYENHKHGRDDFLYGMYHSAKGIFVHPNQTNAMVRRDYKSAEEQFSYLAYPKGSWILHMLRAEVGPELYRRAIKTYLERHQFGNVTTEDLKAVFEELSGRSFDQFFDQYVYHAGHPELNIVYSWDEKTKMAKLGVQQMQKLSEDVLLFKVPLTIRFKSKSDKYDRVITVKEKAEDFYFPLPTAPEIVRIDPDNNLLAKITFVPPAAMINAQLADRSDMLGRLLAIDEVAKRKDEDSVKRLKRVLNDDPFYGVREAASAALRSIQSDSAFEALNSSLKQVDARVRIKVLSDIGGFYREAAFDASRKLLDTEKNPDIQAAAITSFGPYHKKEVQSILLRELNSDSFHNTLADAAINAMRAQDDPDYIDPILASLQERQLRFTSRGYARALGTVAYLAREQQKKETVREFLLKHVNDKRKPIQLAAISALGTLGDAKALPVLEKFAEAPKESSDRAAAEKAVASLRDSRKTSVELGTLRNELLSLQKENRELRKQFDDLKKKIEAAIPQTAPLRTNKPIPSPRGGR